MSQFDRLQLDADGYLDMDAFPADGPDLPEADAADLRTALLADPVDEPTPDEWSVLLDETLAEAADPLDDPGPFTFDDLDLEAPRTPVDPVEAEDPDPDAEVDEGPDADDDDDGAAPDPGPEAGDDLDAALDLDVALDLDGAVDLDGATDLVADGDLDVALDGGLVPGGDEPFPPCDGADGLPDAGPDIDDPL